MDYLARATELQDVTVANRRYIHQNAETGMDLPNTVAYVIKNLESYGYKPEIVGGGVTCTVGKPGKVILLRGDMDALVQNEISGVPYACTSGVACHSCGHDTHTAMLLTAAKMLKENEENLNGTVKFMFQPGEEVILGAKTMVEAGILENPKPDAAVAIHIALGPAHYIDADTGEEFSKSPGIMTYAPGPATQSADEFWVTVKGLTCHGSEPHLGVSAISAACNMVVALQQMISMEVSCKDVAVMTVCKFEGGTASNILCDEVTFGGTLRTFDNDLRTKLRGRFEAICKGIAEAFRATVDIDYRISVPSAYNDPKFAKEMMQYVGQICPETRPIMTTPGSEDFAWVSANVDKALLMNLCVGGEKEGYIYPGHDPRMTIDEDALRYGAATYAHCATEWLKNNG